MRKIPFLLIIVALLLTKTAIAQRDIINMSDHDDKNYYFGITFGVNTSTYQIHYTAAFANTDTFKRIQPRWMPGFNLGLVGNLKLSNFIDLRFVPSLEFAEKRLVFEYGIPDD